MLNLSNIKSNLGASKRKKRVGRGGKRGTYSGRGIKGQRARSGGKRGLGLLGFKQTLRRIPKTRGFKNSRLKFAPVNFRDLEKYFQDGEKITPEKMIKVGLVSDFKTPVKILASGKLTKKFTVVADHFSKAAQEGIARAGGRPIVREED